MKIRLASLLMVPVFGLSALASAQPAEQQERIAASFVLALGRAPAAGELAQWTKPETASVSDLVARHRQQLQGDAAARRAVVTKAARDAFGRAPAAAELAVGLSANSTYTELMKGHIQWLANHPAEYAEILNRAYQLVIQRDVYPEEIDYWKKQDTLSYAVVVGCVEDWARRNQPGLMVTAGTATVSVNSGYLTTVQLSPAIAAEARAAAGLAPMSEAERTASPGRNLVAAGAERILSGGRIHFVAAGGANLMPTAGRN